MKVKVVDFINKLKEMGFNDETELTFSCIDEDTGDWYDLDLEEEYLSKVFNKNGIDICVNVDNSDYLKYKRINKMNDLLLDIQTVIDNYCD